MDSDCLSALKSSLSLWVCWLDAVSAVEREEETMKNHVDYDQSFWSDSFWFSSLSLKYNQRGPSHLHNTHIECWGLADLEANPLSSVPPSIRVVSLLSRSRLRREPG
jgi:hypothetical protein